MRNPKWHRDEIILALELYFRIEPGQIHARNPEIIQLSETLNKLPIHSARPDTEKFRNPNGVSLKMSNFLAIDPDYHGKGMEAYSKLDKSVFEEFSQEKQELSLLAQKVKQIVSDSDLNEQIYKIQPDEDEENFTVKEGQVIYKLHKYRERDSKISRKKKESVLKKEGRLACEACTFDFYQVYGELGKGYIECHHRVPLASLEYGTVTRLEDLALVCANCHRMLHRGIETMGVEELRMRIKS
ncbi:MAG: HNH endonuclease [Bacteroidia bacterium]|nr:HNH endonuclease [Bacteroidia bacterium]